VESRRLFFSLCFSAQQQQLLAPYQQWALQACPGAKAVAVTNLHLTLFFLGQVTAEQQQLLLQSAAKLRSAAFELELDYLAGFRQPKILYLAPSSIPPALLLLQQQLAQFCQVQGFTEPHAEYRPHITLARQALFEGQQRVTPLRLKVREFALYHSRREGEALEYLPLQRFKLIS